MSTRPHRIVEKRRTNSTEQSKHIIVTVASILQKAEMPVDLGRARRSDRDDARYRRAKEENAPSKPKETISGSHSASLLARFPLLPSPAQLPRVSTCRFARVPVFADHLSRWGLFSATPYRTPLMPAEHKVRQTQSSSFHLTLRPVSVLHLEVH